MTISNTHDITIYHNPRCSKSRQALSLLEEKGVQPRIIHYLDTPPSGAELKKLLNALGISARELMRKGEDAYKSLELSDTSLSEQALIDAMVSHPKLIERPIVMRKNKAVIGRPPENVNALL